MLTESGGAASVSASRMDDPHHLTPALAARVRCVADRAVRPERDFVLYWMTSARRAAFNFSLERAVVWARELKKKLKDIKVIDCGTNPENYTYRISGKFERILTKIFE